MLNVELDRDARIAVLTPHGALERRDFEEAANRIDPVIAESGSLNGLVIHVEKFPGWDSFAAMTSHLKFVKDHHRHVARIAIVTDSTLGDLAETLVSHFVAAEIRHFAFPELAEARAWILDQGNAENHDASIETS